MTSANMSATDSTVNLCRSLSGLSGMDLADGGHRAHDVGLGTFLMRNDDRRAEQLGIGVGTLGAAHVGRRDRQLFDVEAFDIGDEDAAGIERIDRYVEETLYLVGMQVHRHHAVYACGHQQVGYQFRADRHPGPVFPILSCPAEVGDYGHDLVGRSAARGVDHHQQLHQVIRRRERRLDDEYRTPADGLVEAGLELAVAETQYFRLSERRTETRRDFFGKVFRSATRENFDFVDSHRLRGFLMVQR